MRAHGLVVGNVDVAVLAEVLVPRDPVVGHGGQAAQGAGLWSRPIASRAKVCHAEASSAVGEGITKVNTNTIPQLVFTPGLGSSGRSPPACAATLAFTPSVRSLSLLRSKVHMAISNIPTAAAAPSPADPAPAAPAPTQNSVDSPAAAGGRRFGSIIRLRPECVAEYKRYHADAWPAVAQQIRECNIRECPSYAPLPLVLRGPRRRIARR